MKLYLADEEKLNDYTLPDSINESFLFSYIPKLTKIEVFLNIFSSDNKWYFKNDNNISIEKDPLQVELQEFENYKVKITGANYNYILYTFPSNCTNYNDINIENIKSIKIGKNNDNDIIYNNDLMQDTCAEIFDNNGILYIKPNNELSIIFINKRKINNEHELKIGDTIFINNLKIIWMKNFIRIYIPKDNLSLSQNLKFVEPTENTNEKYLNVENGENDIPLFKEENYFFHKPRLTPTYTTETIKIDAPPNNELKDEIPFILTLGTSITMIAFATINFINAYNNIKAGLTGFSVIAPIITSITMIIGSIVFPNLTKRYNKKKSIEREAFRQEKYSKYLEKKQAEINKIIKYQTQTLYDNNLSSKECQEVVLGNKLRLWEKEITDPDYLSIRVGLGNIPASIEISAPEEKFTLDDDNLIDRAINIANNSKELTNVPITISLYNDFISSIVCNTEFKDDFINGIILQLIAMHNPSDLKIVFLTSKDNEYKWKYIKQLPHNISNDKAIRYFSTNEEECKTLVSELEKTFNERQENKNSNANNKDKAELKKELPYYLIITDTYKTYQNITLFEKIMDCSSNLGFSLLMIEKSIRNLPNSCKKYTYVVNKTSCIFEKEFTDQKQINFETEYSTELNMDKIAKELANIPIQNLSEIQNLPTSISFLEMYNVGNIEQLGIQNKWSSNNPITSLQCPIGVHPSGETFKLDLHEKFHGPHGLIAGSTGSGKSEFIITYILSMAINFHPDEVQFVLIDYKGGGLAGAFENRETGIRIPHLAGTLTNLDVSEMNRALVSIESELKRRQAKFNEARDSLGESTIDIYKYQKYYREGVIKDPIPHLFIIADEFAELKSQQPDFMDELISTARIGRSLGVHLILATQKPAGVVNDQIWSNSKFRVCLKVQTTSDSNEMLKKPDAASIKEAGRFYLQVGYDELFELGQSAYAGTTYIPAAKAIKKIDDSLSFINNIGEITKSINNINMKNTNTQNNYGDQLTNIVKYLHNLAINNNIQTKRLWLDAIPGEILISDLIKKYNYITKAFEINPVIGEYDSPKQQKQELLTLNISEGGNTLITGIQGSGKENLLSTIITSICCYHTTKEINIYIIDFGSETLKIFNSYPQVGDVTTTGEIEKLNNLYLMLTRELENRKELFRDYLGSYQNYIKESRKSLPHILCIINGYENFYETQYNICDKFTTLFKDGNKFGISFIITSTLTNIPSYRVSQLFTNKIALKLADPSEYRYHIDAPKELIPANHLGRGIIKLDKAYEFQTAYISKLEETNKRIKEIGESLNSQIKEKARAIPVMPRFLTVDKLLNTTYTLENIPIGITKEKLKICTYNFAESNFTPIISNNIRKHIHFIYGLVEILKQITNIKIRIIDVLKIYNNSQGVDLFNNDFDTLIKQIKIEIINDGKRKKNNLFIIIGLGAFKNNVTDKTRKIFNEVFEEINKYKTNRFIVIDDYNSYKSLEIESWFNANIQNSDGIWLGEGAANQFSIKMSNVINDIKKPAFPQMAYAVKKSNETLIRYIVDKEFDDEE